MSSTELGWLDIHAHFSLPETPEQSAQNFHALRQAQFLMSKPYIWNVNEVLDYLDRAGIAMQMLSKIPSSLFSLRASNDYGNSLVRQFPSRFGLLAALPTNNPDACLEEIARTMSGFVPPADGVAVTTVYNGVWLSDSMLDPVWAELDKRHTTVFVHPDAYAGPREGRPASLVEVAFDTTRTIVDMLYKGVFRRFPHIRFVIAHAGACIPALSGRLALLGTEDWVPNDIGLTRTEIEIQLNRLYMDTAASAATALEPAIRMVGIERCIYGTDCGVPCSTELTMEENRQAVLEVERRATGKCGQIGMNGWMLFPEAAKRARLGGGGHRTGCQE